MYENVRHQCTCQLKILIAYNSQCYFMDRKKIIFPNNLQKTIDFLINSNLLKQTNETIVIKSIPISPYCNNL